MDIEGVLIGTNTDPVGDAGKQGLSLEAGGRENTRLAAGMSVPEWVRRHYGNGGLHVPPGRLTLNAVDIEQFLHWCRGLSNAEAVSELIDLAGKSLNELVLTVLSQEGQHQRLVRNIFYLSDKSGLKGANSRG